MLLIKILGDIKINPGLTSNAIQISHNNRAVKCLELNAWSLIDVTKANYGEIVSNLERFRNFVYSEDINIVFVNETWLSASIHNGEILHSGYTIIRNDREGRGGGVLFEIRMGLFKSVREIKHSHNLEIVLVQLTTVSDSKILICSCYRLPNHRLKSIKWPSRCGLLKSLHAQRELLEQALVSANRRISLQIDRENAFEKEKIEIFKELARPIHNIGLKFSKA